MTFNFIIFKISFKFKLHAPELRSIYLSQIFIFQTCKKNILLFDLGTISVKNTAE